MSYLLSDVNDQSVYMTGQFFRDSAINPCIKSSYQFVEHLMKQVIDMHKVQLSICSSSSCWVTQWLEHWICDKKVMSVTLGWSVVR